MADLGLNIKVLSDNAPVKELAELLSKVAASFGGATAERVKKDVAGMVNSVKKATQETIADQRSANEIRAQAEKEYTDLKHEYVLKGLDATRQAIHEEEQSVKASRDAIQKAVREGAGKETQAVLKGERDKQNARLQGLRSVEKELTGARTFTEQLEKNVYGPINEKAKSGGAISALLFGSAGTLKKNATKAEAEAKESEEKVAEHAKEAAAQMTALETKQAEQVKEIDSRIATAKSSEEKKELEATKQSINQQIEEEKHLTKEKQAQESIQLQHHSEMLKKEAADSKAEMEKELAAKKAEAQKEGGIGGAIKGLGGGIIGGAGIMGAVKLFKMADEKAKEANNAQIQLQQGSGLAGEALKKQGEEAEKLGDKYGITGDAAKGMEGTISSMTHATGADLNKQTEAIIAYASTHKRANQTVEEAASKVMKQYGTNALLRAQIDSESALNQKKAMAAMNTPAMQEKKAMAEVTTAIGQLASMVMNALGPVLSALSPIVKTITSTLGAVLKPILHALTPIIADVSGAIADMLPPVMELVKAALGLLEPVLIPLKAVFHAILPILETVVKQVSTALAPVFKALTPILKEVAGLIGELASTYIKTYFIPTLNILLPILTQLLVPVLMSLMPLLKMIADLLSTVLTPTLKIFGDIMNWIVTNAIQPLVKWLTGALLDGVNQVVGVITKAVGAITSVVGAITSFLGVADKASQDTIKGTADAYDAAAASMQATDEAATETQKANLTARLADIQAKETAGVLTHAQAIAEQKQAQDAFDGWKKKLTDNETAYTQSEATKRNAIIQAASDKQKAILTEQFKSGKLTAEQYNAQVTALQTKAASASVAIDQKSIDQTKSMSLAEEAELKQRISSHTATIAEIKAAELKAEQSGNQTFADYLKHYESSASDAPKKAKGGGAAKAAKTIAKEKLDAEIAGANDILEQKKLEIAAERETDKQKKVEEIQAERVHLTAIRDLYDVHSKQYQKAQLKLTAFEIQATKDGQAAQIETLHNATDRAVSELDIRALKEGMTAKQSANAKYQIQVKAMRDEITLRKSWGDDVSKLQMQLDTTILKHDTKLAIKRRTLGEEEHQTDLATQKQEIQDEIAMRQAHGQAVADLDKQLNDIAIQEENERWKKEQATRKDDILNADGTLNALGQSLEANHQGKLTAIAQQGALQQRSIQMKQMAFMLGPFSSAFNQSFGQVDKIMQKSTATMFGHKTAFSQMMGEVVTGYAKMGVAAIMHANISQVADAAAAAGKFALAAASAIASAFETIPFPLDIVAAGAALAGVVLLASKAKSIKLAEGGILTRPTFARNYEAGEAGHEAVIPLSSSRGQDALGTKALGEKIDKSNQLMSTQNEHLSAIRKAGQPTGGHYSPSAMYGAQAGINRALVIANRRVMK